MATQNRTMQKETGIVRAVRKDGKGLQLDNEQWYSDMRIKEPLQCGKGDTVEVEYTVNGNFNNLKSLKIMTKKQVMTPTMQKEIREDVNASQLTSYAKDIVVAVIGQMGTIELSKIKTTTPEMMEIAAKAISKAYLAIKKEIAQPQGKEQATESSEKGEGQ